MKVRKRLWVWILVAVWIVALPAAVLAASHEQPPSDGFLGTLIAPLLHGIRWVLVSLGMQEIKTLVFNIPSGGDDPLIFGTFREYEISVVRMLWVAFEVIVGGVLIGLAAMLVGLKLAGAGPDAQKRAQAMETLKNLAIAAGLVILSGPIIWVLFELNSLLVGVFRSWSPEHNISDLWLSSGVTTSLGEAIITLFGIIVEFALNLTYLLRKFALIVLAAISPIALFFFTFDSSRNVTRLWFQEFISNLAIQPVHALLLALFFHLYLAAGRDAFMGLAFLLILQPLTNLVRGVISAGRSSNFTGMGLASFGVGMMGMMRLGGAMFTAGTSLRALSGAGGSMLASRAMGQMAGGNMSPETMAAMGGMAAFAGAGSGDAAGGAAVASAGAGSSAARAAASAYAPPPNSRLGGIQRFTEGARTVGGWAGRAVGAVAGTGYTLATGDPMGIHIGAAVGGKFGRTVGGGTGGTIALGYGVAREGAGGWKQAFQQGASAAVAQSGMAGSNAAQVSLLGAPAVGKALVGVAGGAWGLAKHAGSSTQRLMGADDPTLQSHEQREALLYNLTSTLGHAGGGFKGAEQGQVLAHWVSSRQRAQAGIPQMGQASLRAQVNDGDTVRLVATDKKTDVYYNARRIDRKGVGAEEASCDNPVVEEYRYRGEAGWQRTPQPVYDPKDPAGPGKDPFVDMPRASWERGLGRGRLR